MSHNMIPNIKEFDYTEEAWAVIVYYLRGTDSFYVTSCKRPSNNVQAVYWKLNRGCHSNPRLQEAYDVDKNIEYVIYTEESEKEAREKAKALRSIIGRNKTLLNSQFSKGDFYQYTDVEHIESDIENHGRSKPMRIRATEVKPFPNIEDTPLPEWMPILSQMTRIGNSEINFKTKVPGMYILHHPSTGKAYVGSTKNLYTRYLTHLSKLHTDCHQNSNLLSAYRSNPNLELFCFKTKVVNEERKLEQRVLDEYWDTGRLFNASPDAVAPIKAYVHKGMKITGRHLESMVKARQKRKDLNKQVSVNDVTYPSIRACARSLNLPYAVVQRRIHSTDPEYIKWCLTT